MLLVPHGSTNVIPGPRCGPRCRTRPRRRRRRWPRRRLVGPPGRGFARLGARPTFYRLLGGDAPTARRPFFFPRQVRSKSGTRAKRSERDERTGCARQLKRAIAFCVLPGCTGGRALDSLPLPAAKASIFGVRTESSTRRRASCTAPLRPLKTKNKAKTKRVSRC